MNRRLRTQQVVDCPKEKRVVPLHALAAGANHDQFTCWKCPHHLKHSCSYVTCKYEG